MLLTPDERDAVMRTRLPLILYIARRLDRHPGLSGTKDLLELPVGELYDLCVTACSRRDLVEDYVSEDPDRLPAGDLALAEGFKHAVYGRFVLLSHTKGHSVLLGPGRTPVAYGIVGLVEELGDHLDRPPYMVGTVLLPFRGRIVHDVAFLVSRDTFGPGARRGLAEACREAEARYGLVTSLPFSGKPRPDADEARLRSLLRSRKSMEAGMREVRELASRSPALERVYHEGLGAIAAREHRHALRVVGAAGGWYAALEGVPVAGGATRKDVERAVEELVPEGRRGLVQYYRAK